MILTQFDFSFLSLFIINNYSSSPKAKWATDSEAMRAREIQLVGQKSMKTKHLLQVKARLQSSFTAKTLQIWRRFSLLVGYNI